MPTVLVTHPAPRLSMYLGDRALARLREVADVRLNDGDADLQGEALVQAAQGCDVVLAYRQTPVDAAVLAALPQLRAVVRCAMDIRTIDVAAASAHGILVTRASAGFMAAVSEWTVGVMIDLARGISDANAQYHATGAAGVRMGRELRGATLGVIGYGQISRHLCSVALAMGMHVLVSDPHAVVGDDRIAQVTLPALLAQSDFVVCLAPATAQTENLMNAAAFTAMKRGAFFINPSRGNLVDDAALAGALDAGHLAGAALDVGRADDQMPAPLLARHPRVIATPHIGGLTPPAVEHQALEAAQQTAAILRGEIPPGAVNAAQATRVGVAGATA